MKSDILILGGGLVGLTAANLLAKKGFSIILIERQKPNLEWSNKDQFDNRCSAISKKSQKIFEHLGAWDAIQAIRVSPYYLMKVWDALGFGEITFDAVEINEPNLGHIIENRVMIKALWELAELNPNIVLKISSPHSIKINSDSVILGLEDKTSLEGQLIIGADGSHSWLRGKQEIKVSKKSYQQSALVATVKTELPHNGIAWQRFLPSGSLAFLPLCEANTSSIVWSSTAEETKMHLNLAEESFNAALSKAFDYKLGHVLSTSKPQSFILEKLHAKEYVKHRVALIGDAIHVVHPLAGLGVNLGLADAFKLMEVLEYAKQKYDIGDYLILRKFERARKTENTMMLNAMSLFKSGFGSTLSGISLLRSLGLNLVDQRKKLKQKFMNLAMGHF